MNKCLLLLALLASASICAKGGVDKNKGRGKGWEKIEADKKRQEQIKREHENDRRVRENLKKTHKKNPALSTK